MSLSKPLSPLRYSKNLYFSQKFSFYAVVLDLHNRPSLSPALDWRRTIPHYVMICDLSRTDTRIRRGARIIAPKTVEGLVNLTKTGHFKREYRAVRSPSRRYASCKPFTSVQGTQVCHSRYSPHGRIYNFSLGCEICWARLVAS